MKRTLLILFLFFLCIGIFSQSYYYYYDGKKQYLEIDTTSVYISASNSEVLKTHVQTKLFSRSLPNIKKIDFSSTKNLQRQKTKEFYWTTQKITKGYKQIVKDLKQSKEIETVSPFFKLGNSESFAMSNLFYVKLKNQSDLGLLEDFCKENKVEIVGSNISMPLWFTLACTKESNGDALDISNRFYESGKFSQAEPDFMSYKQQGVTTEPYFQYQWGLKKNNGLNVEAAWDYTKGKGVVVAVIDAGIELTHPDLNIHPISYNAVTGTSPSSTYGEHGTAVAGIIGAKENGVGVVGVAPESVLMAISVNFGNANSTSHLANSFNFAWQNGADVINNSWGGGSPSSLITDAINNALSKGRNGLGCIITFATGNNDSSVNFPANLSQVIGVGASSTDGKRKSKKSPDTEQWGGCYGAGLDVTAPGVLIPTTDQTGTSGYNPYKNIHKGAGGSLYTTEFTDLGYTKYFNGTSSACPHVSGVAALVLSMNPKLTHTQVRAIIESTARKQGGYSYSTNKTNGAWNNEMGHGFVDAYAACRKTLDNREASIITGSKYVCSTNEFKINSLPAGSTVSWVLENSPNKAPYPILVLNTSNQYACSVKNQYAYPLTCRLVATVTLPNGAKHYPNMEIISEPNPSTSVKGKLTQYRSPDVNISNTFDALSLFIRPNIEATIKFTGIPSTRNVALATFAGNGKPLSWYYNKANTTLSVTLPSQGGSAYVFYIGDEASCSKTQFTLFASNTATRSVEVNDNTIGTINVYDIFSGRKVYTQKDVLLNSFDLRSTNLKTGYYLVETETETKKSTNKVYLSY